MSKIILIVFVYLIFCSLCQNQIELNIEEGVYSYTFEPHIIYNFTLNAVSSGTYVIIFPDTFKIIEATGDVHEALYDSEYEYTSRVYSQKFAKGDYIKLQYPDNIYDTLEGETKKIRIEKKNAFFNPNTQASPYIYNIAMNKCNKPMYFFLDNTLLKGMYNICYSFLAKVHSGDFFGSYRTTEFDPDFPIDKDFEDFDISSLTDLPYDYFNHHLVILKLQCREPGLISIFIARGTYLNLLNSVGLQAIKEGYDFNVKISKENAYIQVINLYGNTSIDLTKYKDNIYYNDFYIKLEIENHNTVEIPFKIFGNDSMILTSMSYSESKSIIAKEYEAIEVKSNKRVIIPLLESADKKYIKINSTVNGFYWDYQYSQTSDINYLISSPSRRPYHFQRGNVVYIDNPYKYNKIKKHFNYMFITFKHYNEENSTFYYEYTNENDIKEETEEEESDKYETDEYKSDKYESDKSENDRYDTDEYKSDKFNTDKNESDKDGKEKEGNDEESNNKSDGSHLLIYQSGILLMLLL